MSNIIKYSTGSESLALKKNNFYIGVGDVGKGPTSTSGFYNGYTPPLSGYTVYLNKESGGPSIYTCSNDSEAISLTNAIAGQSFSTIHECLTWFRGQSDKMIVNIDYPPIVTNGLIFNLDAGFVVSYPKTGNTWYDSSINTYNGTLVNGPLHNSSDGGGCITFDGSDDKCFIGGYPDLAPNQVTLSIWTYLTTFNGGGSGRIIAGMNDVENWRYGYFIFTYPYLNQGPQVNFGVSDNSNDYQMYLVSLNQWYNFVLTFGGGIQKSYSNGVLLGTKSRSMSYRDTNRFQIGDGYNYNNPYAGKISSVQIYNRVLSESEVLQNYQVMLPRFLGENIVTSGLIGYWDSGYSSSYPTTGTILYNVAGTSGGTGTLTNGPTYSSNNGGNIVYDGTNDYVDLGNYANLGSEPFSISAWFKYTSNGNYQSIINKGTGVGIGYGYRILITPNNKIYADASDNTTSGVFESVSSLTQGQWTNVCFVRSSSLTNNFTIYINGVSDNSVTKNIGSVSSSLSLNFGRQSDVGTYLLKGNIAIVSIYNRQLSSSEILQNYDNQKGRFGL